MIRVHIFCEGQTEETFVQQVLSNHFIGLNISLNPIILHTSKHGKGGATHYGKIKRQVLLKCKEDPSSWVTTLIDFYGLPQDFPGTKENQNKPSIQKALSIEKAFQTDIAQNNFIAFLVIHEFEGLLFSSPQAFSDWYDEKTVSTLKTIRNDFPSPEHINQSPASAPSKRILSVCSNYDKVLHGSLIALGIGLEVIRNECSYFSEWIKKLESLPGT